MNGLPQDHAEPPGTAVAELMALARAQEPERYLAATLAPEPQRAALMALAAYQGDLARIAATATQPLLGEIRLQWWRDSLEVIAKGGRIGSPLADALGDACSRYQLPTTMLVAMSEALAFDLYNDPMPDQASFDGYLSKTEAIPFELALRVLGVAAGDASRLGMLAGRVFGMTRVLQRLPETLAAGHLPLPVTLLKPHDITMETLLTQPATAAPRAMLAALSSSIVQDLATLRPQFWSLSRAQRVALLPLAAVPAYLKAINRPSRDPLRDIATLAPLVRVCRIGLAHITGWI